MNEIKTMIEALRILSHDIQSGDGVANACVADAANMIESLSEQLAKANERIEELESYNLGLANESHEYQQRCLALDEIADTAFKYNHSSAECLRAWNKLQQLRKEQGE